MKMKVKGNVFSIYCNELTEMIFNKINELLKVSKNIQVEVFINNKI